MNYSAFYVMSTGRSGTTGERTRLDAIEFSQSPVIISHANARGMHDNARNVSDELIRDVASRAEVVGTVGFPAFVKSGPDRRVGPNRSTCLRIQSQFPMRT